MSKRKHADTQPTTSTQQPPIFESTPIHDRSSTFTALFTPSTTNPHTHQNHPPFQSAAHKILAWRKPSTQQSLASSFTSQPTGSSQGGRTATKVVCETGSDEDGEKYAGKKLEKVLTEMDVLGTVVVARWFGGVMLGPVRFKWIEDSAREAIMKWKASVGVDEGRGGVETKKVKVDEGEVVDEAKQKEKVVRVLKERDASVDVLRGLLAEKNVVLKKLEAGGVDEEVGGETKQAEPVKSPAVVPDYASMPLQRLKQLEKARDATLAWILKQIDTVEEKIKVASNTKNESKG